MEPRGFLIRGIGLALCMAAALQGQDNIVGSVKMSHPGATIVRGANALPATDGAHILLNDTLRSSGSGGLTAILQDGTRISLGPNAELKIDRFVYQPADGKFGMLLQLLHGAMAYVSGKISQFSPGSVSVETPVGVLGLRGTSFAVSLEGN